MKTSFHRIYTKDSLELHGLLYEPDKKAKTVLAFIHGMGGNFYENKFLDNLAETLTQNNIAFCPFNNRGNSFMTDFLKKTEKGIKFVTIGNANEKFEDCVLDIKAHIDFLQKQGFTNIHLSGHSLGSPKIAYYAAKTKDKRIKSLIFISPSDMLGLVREEPKRFKQNITMAKRMIKQKKGNELMPTRVWDEYPITANTYLSIFGDDSKAVIFNFYNPELGYKILSQIPFPIFTTMGRKDDVLVIPIEDIMRIIKEKAKSSPRREHEIIGDAPHSYRGFEESLTKAILTWIKSFRGLI